MYLLAYINELTKTFLFFCFFNLRGNGGGDFACGFSFTLCSLGSTSSTSFYPTTFAFGFNSYNGRTLRVLNTFMCLGFVSEFSSKTPYGTEFWVLATAQATSPNSDFPIYYFKHLPLI